MGTIGYGCGSEWQLLRYLGYHRAYLTREVLKETGGDSIDWLDFAFSKQNIPLRDDEESVGVDFIPGAQDQWKKFWPQTGNAQNWDAVGKIWTGNSFEWLLVEAKGHRGEVTSECGATKPESIKMIRAALDNARMTFSKCSQPVENWLKPYYQYANRLTALHFLMKDSLPDSFGLVV